MTSIFCHHPAVIFDKQARAEEPCPDCGVLVPNQQNYPTVTRYLNEERRGAAADQTRSAT